MRKIWIELNGGEEISHIISWCTRKVRHPAKRLVLTETTHCHSSRFEIVFTDRPLRNDTVREVWESIEFLYLVLYLNKGSVLRAAWAGTQTHSPQLVWGGWAVWLQLAGCDAAGGRHQRLPAQSDFICGNVQPRLRRFVQWLGRANDSVEHLRHRLYERELLSAAAGF